MGAYAKPGDIPQNSGLFLMDVVPDGEPMFGFPNISDNAKIVEMIASGGINYPLYHWSRICCWLSHFASN